MIRWSYLLPRLVLLGALLVVAHVAIPVVVRWSLTHGWRAATGTVMGVDSVRLSVVRGRLRLDGAEFARSRASRTNFLEFDSAELSLDLGELARRRCVVNSAHLHGIRLDTPRRPDSSPEPLRQVAPPDLEPLMRSGREMFGQWMDQLVGQLERRLEDEFGSLRLLRDLAHRWPAEYEQFARQVRSCRSSIEQLRAGMEGRSPWSLDPATLAEWQKRSQELTHLQNQIVRLHGQLERLVRQAQDDRLAVENTLSEDRKSLRGKMQIARLDGQQLTDYLMASETYRRWRQIEPYLSLAQSFFRSPQRSGPDQRGTDIDLEARTPGPSLLIRSASLAGRLPLAGTDVAFVGKASNLSTEPGRSGQPARVQLQIKEPFAATLYSEFDTPGDLPRQRLVLQCLGLPVASRTWGNPDQLAVRVAAGQLNVYADLARLGTEVSGRVVCAQEHVQLAVTDASFGQRGGTAAELWRHGLAAAARRVNRFELRVTVTGSLEAPRWSVQSDLGRELETALQDEATKVLHAYTDQLIARADQQVTAELARWQAELSARQRALEQEIGIGEQMLSALVESVAARVKPLDQLLHRM